MWTAKWILDTYERGDGAVRSDMYMVYRELRPYFDEIETRLKKVREEGSIQISEKPAGAWWAHCCRLVRG